MIIKGITPENFVDYKKTCMVIAFPKCSFKCGCDICQNSALAQAPNIEISPIEIVSNYVKNPITKAVVCAGLEPFDSRADLLELIAEFRKYTNDDIVIYTGYTEEELESTLDELRQYKNIIIKFGRFIPNQESHYDEVLGVKLASPNQYAKKVS